MHGLGGGVPGLMGHARLSYDQLTGTGSLLHPVDAKPRSASDDLPALPQLGVDVLRPSVSGLGPVVVHLQQSAIGFSGRLAEHDPLAGHGMDQFVSGARHDSIIA